MEVKIINNFFDFDYFMDVFPTVASGIPVTLRLTFAAGIVALLIGLITAVISYFKIPVLSQLVKLYVSIMRGTPAVTQIYFFYYGLALFIAFIRDMDALTAVAVIMSFNVGAFMSESIRAALNSVDKGQIEAGNSLGMTRLQIMQKVVIPQAARIAIPPLFNNFINLIKMSSLAFMIGIPDIMGEARMEGSRSLRFFEAYAVAMIFYWVIIQLFEFIQSYIEKRSSRAYI